VSAVGLLATLGGAAPGAPDNIYGHDWSCTNDVDIAGVEVDGITCLAQALYRRLITPRGGLIDDPNYGFDIQQFLNDDFFQNGTVTQGSLAMIASQVDSEMRKDERVLRSQTTMALGAGGVITLAIAITPLAGPNFKLVIAASAVTVQLLQVAV